MKMIKFAFVFMLAGLSFAEIIDKEKLLDASFVYNWNTEISRIEKEIGVKINLLISGNNKIDAAGKIPTITIIYRNSLKGFEIYQSNFANESNFIIPSSFFLDVIPEANELFNSQKKNQAAEYILMNVKEILLYYNADDIVHNTQINNLTKKAKFYGAKAFLAGFALSIVVFLYVVFGRKKKSANVNRSCFFGGLSRTGFFGGDFDNIEWSYDREKN